MQLWSRVPVLVLVAVAATALSALWWVSDTVEHDDQAHLQLFTGCQKLRPQVALWVGNKYVEHARQADMVALSRAVLLNMLKERLFRADLYARWPPQQPLYIFDAQVSVDGPAYKMMFKLNHFVHHEGEEHPDVTTMWERLPSGMHGHDDRRVYRAFSDQVDGFVSAYQAANDGYCSS